MRGDDMRLSTVITKKLMPLFMRADQFDVSLCEGIDLLVKDAYGRILEKLQFWQHFDAMTEEQLDEAAEELKVHWYRYDANVEMKRKIIQNAKVIKRKIGTPYAIEEVLQIYFQDAHLIEWWEYGGTRKHFKIQTYNTSTINEDADAFMAVLDKIKRKATILDYVEVLDYSTNDILYVIVPGTSTRNTDGLIGGTL